MGELCINVFVDVVYLLIELVIFEFVCLCFKVKFIIVVDDKFIDIVSEGYDVGICYGYYVLEGMVIVLFMCVYCWVVVVLLVYLDWYGWLFILEDL